MSLRLAKLIANQRFCSRREAERLLINGKVSVNGSKIFSPNGAAFVKDGDNVEVHGIGSFRAGLKRFKPTVYAFNKPLGQLVSYSDPLGRPTIFQHIERQGHPKNLIPVGRLDYNTSGLILLTDDGMLARNLALPSRRLKRTYRANVSSFDRSPIDDRKLKKLQKKRGLMINNVQFGPVSMKLVNKSKATTSLDVTVADGKYREVRRILETSGLNVLRLHRTEFGPFALKSLMLPKGTLVQVEIPPVLMDHVMSETESTKLE